METGTSLRTLYGHDGELTYVSCHQTKPLVITSSRKYFSPFFCEDSLKENVLFR